MMNALALGGVGNLCCTAQFMLRRKISGVIKHPHSTVRLGAEELEARANPKGNSMSNLNLEVPAEVRDFAEKTVDQARKAFDSFLAAAQKASAQSEAAAESLGSNAKDLSAKAISFAESNIKGAFDLAEKLIHAKDPKEFLAIQSEYLKEQVASVTEQTKALGEAVKKAVVPTDSK
jgi:phasin